MDVLYSLTAVWLMIMVPGSEGNGEEVKSPIKALGETPTCPEGPPTYELIESRLPKYCVWGSKFCEEGEGYQNNRKTYFNMVIINCKDKLYLIIAFTHIGFMGRRFILETLTVGKTFPTIPQIVNSVFPVYSGFVHVVIYYKMEDDSYYKVTYKLLETPQIKHDEVKDENNASGICKAVKLGLPEFVRKDKYKHWCELQICPTLEKEREKIDKLPKLRYIRDP